MNDNYNSRQKKIYSDYSEYPTDELINAVKENKYVDSVIEIIKDILEERKVKVSDYNSRNEQVTKDDSLDYEYFMAKKGARIHAYFGILISIILIGLGLFVTFNKVVYFKYGPIGFIAALGYGIYNLVKVYKIFTLKVGIGKDHLKINDQTTTWNTIESAEYRIASYLDPVVILKLSDGSVMNIPAVISELDYIKSKIEKNIDHIIRNNE